MLSEPEVAVNMFSFWSKHGGRYRQAFVMLQASYDAAAVAQLDIMLHGWLTDAVLGRVDLQHHAAIRALVRCNILETALKPSVFCNMQPDVKLAEKA